MRKHVFTSLAAGIVLLLSLTGLQAQDIAAYAVNTGEEDIFAREVMAALGTSTMSEALPGLGCTVEYIRRLEGEDIVYRRGPIDMHIASRSEEDISQRHSGTRPASPFDAAGEVLHGGLLVDLPRPGESSDLNTILPEGYRYMLRVALIPQSYDNQILKATVFLERAVVSESGDELDVYRSEVFSRPIELVGNLPLKFDLPGWDSSLPDGGQAVPPSLHEGVLITLETPHQYSLPGSSPHPFKNKALLTYAVPRSSEVRLSIRIGSEERILAEGMRNAGTYSVVWDAEDLPDEEYTAVLTARDSDGNTMFSTERTVIKQATAEDFDPGRLTTYRGSYPRFVISVESGAAYQLPRDNVKSLRNMFTHVVLRLGYRFSDAWEAGVMAGQDAFHEYPGSNVDIAKIGNYGGVVGYTYGYVGPYLRWTPAIGQLRPFLQASAGWSDTAMLTEFSAGLAANIMRNIEVFAAPALVLHWKTERSTKIGVHYGARVRF